MKDGTVAAKELPRGLARLGEARLNRMARAALAFVVRLACLSLSSCLPPSLPPSLSPSPSPPPPFTETGHGVVFVVVLLCCGGLLYFFSVCVLWTWMRCLSFPSEGSRVGQARKKAQSSAPLVLGFLFALLLLLPCCPSLSVVVVEVGRRCLFFFSCGCARDSSSGPVPRHVLFSLGLVRFVGFGSLLAWDNSNEESPQVHV